MNFFEDRSDGKVAIPFKVGKNGFEFYLGGDLPKLKEDTYGEIIVYPHAILDKQFRRVLTDRRDVLFLKSGTSVFAAMNPAPSGLPLPTGLTHIPSRLPSQAFGEIELLETQHLRLYGTTRPKLTPAKCRVLSLNREAISLNHAYTLLSEHFEKHRTSHTANVFQKLYVRERGQEELTLLDDLRSRQDVLYEKRLEPGDET